MENKRNGHNKEDMKWQYLTAALRGLTRADSRTGQLWIKALA